MKKRIKVPLAVLLFEAIVLGSFLLFFGVARACGHSMEPAIMDGDLVVTTAWVDKENMAIGSIVCYQYNSTMLVSHRIVDVGSDDVGCFYVFQGDNNLWADPDVVRPSQIMAVVVWIPPHF